MAHASPRRIWLLGPGANPADALVLMLSGFTQEGRARDAAAVLGAALPHTLFAVLELDLDGTEPLLEVEATIGELCLQLGLASSQVILLARGPTAGLALDATLQGADPLCGVIVVDPSPLYAPPSARWRGARVRILQREFADPDGARVRALTRRLHAAEVDVRSLFLPNGGDDAPVLRAAEAFLAELTACASRAGERRSGL